MQTYGLKLCGGQQWCLIDSTENIHWSREFIKSSGLQLCQDAYLPAIIIVGCSRNHRSVPEIINSLDCKISKFLPSSGWRLVERNMCRCWFHDRQLLFICELRDNKLGPREAKFLTFLALSNLLYPFYFYALSHGGLPLHAALIERHGQGFLLVADKNTGKSTC